MIVPLSQMLGFPFFSDIDEHFENHGYSNGYRFPLKKKNRPHFALWAQDKRQISGSRIIFRFYNLRPLTFNKSPVAFWEMLNWYPSIHFLGVANRIRPTLKDDHSSKERFQQCCGD